MTARIGIKSYGELVEVVPFLLGFTPEESLVFIALKRDGSVYVTGRLDLGDVDQLPRAARALLSREPDLRVALLAYSESPQWGPLAEAAKSFPEVFLQAQVTGDVWYADGESGRVNGYGSAATQAVFAGLSHAGSRADKEARFASGHLPVPNPPLSALDLAEDPLAIKDPQQLAAIATIPRARDKMLLLITKENVKAHLALWLGVLTAVEPCEGVTFLAGMASWISGDGVGVVVAIEQFEERWPNSPRRKLLESIERDAIHPSRWEEIREGLIG